jgi:hypothetical protein
VVALLGGHDGFTDDRQGGLHDLLGLLVGDVAEDLRVFGAQGGNDVGRLQRSSLEGGFMQMA